jgi:5-methylcytosine-specific restriction protein A
MQGGRVDPASLPKGPSGRALCRFCGNEVPPSRVTFCSPACVRGWKVRTDKAFARRMVFRRDKGVCALCGTDCVGWLKTLREEWRGIRADGDMERRKRNEASFRSSNPDFFRRESLWDADHVVPVVDGGGGCGLENLRTLCLFCHRKVTAELVRKRAMERRTVAKKSKESGHGPSDGTSTI